MLIVIPEPALQVSGIVTNEWLDIVNVPGPFSGVSWPEKRQFVRLKARDMPERFAAAEIERAESIGAGEREHGAGLSFARRIRSSGLLNAPPVSLASMMFSAVVFAHACDEPKAEAQRMIVFLRSLPSPRPSPAGERGAGRGRCNGVPSPQAGEGQGEGDDR